ncbi:hypothetical protein GCM10008904_32570 [Paraclostridium ghonii]|uniref:SPP1 family phage portal protein n=1 Tax=Paraclostridium ghonii TaxID=29358 RepID=A0ABU0MXJ4_9FIRM|nr:phage portal protein [Paeniclostridium ghonii]MDQ0555338.1 SPP1 family phage portal protein [Paeniclostridium ghonii]
MNIEIIKKNYDKFKLELGGYNKMYSYYKGDTDTVNKYPRTDRSNLITPTNYIKKFIKEEISYSVSNDITYISKKGHEEVINDIDYYLSVLDEDHDIELFKNMLIYGLAYEIYFINQYNEFDCKVISPRSGRAIKDGLGNTIGFIHIFNRNDNEYIDFYEKDYIYHFDSKFNQVLNPTKHIFGCVPVGIAKISEEEKDDTLYKDLKGLQDSLEQIQSDYVNEISDTRTAYLVLSGVELGEENEAKDIKRKGIIQIPNGDGTAQFLIKNISPEFIKNAISNLDSKIFSIASHIDTNERMQSNTSSLALKTRLIAVDFKCKLNQKAMSNCIKTRLHCLFTHLRIIFNKNYDVRDIKIKFTSNIPADDLTTAQMISQVGDKLSTETALSLFSFITNPKNELTKIKAEQEYIVEGKQLLEEDDLDE